MYTNIYKQVKEGNGMKQYEYVALDVDSVEVIDVMDSSSGEWLEIGDYNELSDVAKLEDGFYMVKGTKQVVEIEDGILFISYIDGESEFLDYIHNIKKANGIEPIAQKGDVIAVDDCGETVIGVVVDRYYEGGIEDNGVKYLTTDGELYCAYDGCYEIVENKNVK